jgi:hypothetical protein
MGLMAMQYIVTACITKTVTVQKAKQAVCQQMPCDPDKQQ